jgi:glycine/D-amino acid oxidase-like deaminating enzyme
VKIAVIGNGIVGATFVNEMIERFPTNEIIQFDGIKGTATTASAGIIAPWLSKRRNKKWYNLARQGAEYINQIASQYKMPKEVYFKSGVIYTRDEQAKLDELLELAQERIKTAPQMESFKLVSNAEIKQRFNFIKTQNDGLFVAGGARIDGQNFIEFLNQRNQANFELRKVEATLSRKGDQVLVNGEAFDKIVLTAGAWLKTTLANIGVEALTRPQKGQLIEIELPDGGKVDPDAPVLMPEGERDFIPTSHGTLLIGATHENDQGFDLTVSDQIIDDLLASGQRVIPNLDKSMVKHTRVGTRAYTEDFAPFFGYLPNDTEIMVASGLGSSGLTTGPLIGKLLVDLIEDPSLDIGELTKPIEMYIKSR